MREIPYSSRQVLQLPVLLCVIAVFIYLFAFAAYKNRGRMTPLRFGAHLFAVLGFLAGCQQVWKLYNPNTSILYRQAIGGSQKILLAHYVAAIAPLVLLALFFLFDARSKKAAKDYDMEEED